MFSRKSYSRRKKNSVLKKENGWKTWKILFLLFILVLFGFLLSSAVKIKEIFSVPLKPAVGSAEKKNYWDGKGQFNFLLVELDDFKAETPRVTSLLVGTLDTSDRSLSLLKLEKDIYLEAPRGLGFYTIDSLYSLGGLQEPKANTALLMESVSELLAVPLDGYFLADRQGVGELTRTIGSEELRDIIGTVRSISFWFKLPEIKGKINNYLKTDLSLIELFRLVAELRRLYPEKLYLFTDLSEEFEKISLPDGSSALTADQDKLDVFIKEVFSDNRVIEEQTRVKILNSTEYAGLAAKASRYINNLGGEVLSLENAPEGNLEKTRVVLYSEKARYTAERLAFIFNCLVEEEFLGDKRSDVTLVIGEDYWKRLKGSP